MSKGEMPTPPNLCQVGELVMTVEELTLSLT